MGQFIIEEVKNNLRITPILLTGDGDKKQMIIKNDNNMSLRELKQQISEFYNIKVKDINLLLF